MVQNMPQTQIMEQPPEPHQQSQMLASPYIINQGYGGSVSRVLPQSIQIRIRTVGLFMLILGLLSLILGVIGFFLDGYTIYDDTPSFSIICNVRAYVYLGTNIWCGFIYALSGVFSLLSNQFRDNAHLMNTFYAFSIISFIMSLAHFGLSFGLMFHDGQHCILWYNAVSMLISIGSFALSLVVMIVLGHQIYCRSNLRNAISVHYMTGHQLVAFGQPVPMGVAYSAGQPVYVQTTPNLQYTTEMNRAAIFPPQQPPPQYDQLVAINRNDNSKETENIIG
ncbi:uncharacterized protein TRIADDRAFT_61177 [Trichoplax adhaerens]|uniref:Uncharacterized protein n=1 Tax=Trichoplax adhaerens TaxID=10228 RepID=B3SA89_TRIAD|nr:predicted protein [Trichoplax adhaerens]EDV20396.1 predicted protein [Trichoplax adhaerens]|eukprot:XP_002117090.1 predicted protein [Trichoplax adhaerens]